MRNNEKQFEIKSKINIIYHVQVIYKGEDQVNIVYKQQMNNNVMIRTIMISMYLLW